MKVTIETNKYNPDDWENINQLRILVNDKQEFCVSDGEPEDSNLSRDFSDCYNIGSLMQTAYNAGKAGEDFSIEQKEIEE